MRIGQQIHFRLVIIQNYIEVIYSGEQRFQREQMLAFTHSYLPHEATKHSTALKYSSSLTARIVL
jgi:hypothetical protein